MTEGKLSQSAQYGITGMTVTKVFEDHIILGEGLQIYIDTAEAEHINSMFPPKMTIEEAQTEIKQLIESIETKPEFDTLTKALATIVSAIPNKPEREAMSELAKYVDMSSETTANDVINVQIMDTYIERTKEIV